MGLDQYGYAIIEGGEKDGEQHDLADWRKHNRLHGWMEQLFREKGNEVTEEEFGNSFNCVPVELTESALDQLEADICDKTMPETGGFFFGHDSFDWEDDDGNEYEGSDYYYKETDLKFIEDARKALKEGKKVYYTSWW